MARWLIAAAAMLAATTPGAALAGAWSLPKGDGQVILKYEGQSADEAFGASQTLVPIPDREDQSLSAFVEYGLTNTLTLQGKAAVERGEDGGFEYSGRGPVEIGLRQRLFTRKGAVVSLYAGTVFAGEGRNAGYAPPGQGDGDVELRLLAGSSRKLWGVAGYQEVQVARLWRRGLPDETRVDTTVGLRLTPRWTLMAQTYAGRADAPGVNPWWVKAETSVVHDIGRWSLQAGWRATVAGREVPADNGPVIAVWRRF